MSSVSALMTTFERAFVIVQTDIVNKLALCRIAHHNGEPPEQGRGDDRITG